MGEASASPLPSAHGALGKQDNAMENTMQTELIETIDVILEALDYDALEMAEPLAWHDFETNTIEVSR